MWKKYFFSRMCAPAGTDNGDAHTLRTAHELQHSDHAGVLWSRHPRAPPGLSCRHVAGNCWIAPSRSCHASWRKASNPSSCRNGGRAASRRSGQCVQPMPDIWSGHNQVALDRPRREDRRDRDSRRPLFGPGRFGATRHRLHGILPDAFVCDFEQRQRAEQFLSKSRKVGRRQSVHQAVRVRCPSPAGR